MLNVISKAYNFQTMRFYFLFNLKRLLILRIMVFNLLKYNLQICISSFGWKMFHQSNPRTNKLLD